MWQPMPRVLEGVMGSGGGGIRQKRGGRGQTEQTSRQFPRKACVRVRARRRAHALSYTVSANLELS